jgi:uncharacterized protein (TIGR04168 family)
VWWTPGNHDVVTLGELVRTLRGEPVEAGPILVRWEQWRNALAPAVALAWDVVPVGELYVVAGRPFTIGGPCVANGELLEAVWGIRTLAESTARLLALVERVPVGAPVLVVNHNGPTGCGAGRADTFGRDFDPAEGDWGDPDLGALVAAFDGRNPTLVIAGHMHRTLRGGGERSPSARVGEVDVVNAAVVPRKTQGMRHWVEVRINGTALTAWDIVWDMRGPQATRSSSRIVAGAR